MISTELTIALVSFGVTSITIISCVIMAYKRKQSKVISHRIKVQSNKDIKANDLLNENNVWKNHIKTIKDDKELTTSEQEQKIKRIQKLLGNTILRNEPVESNYSTEFIDDDMKWTRADIIC